MNQYLPTLTAMGMMLFLDAIWISCVAHPAYANTIGQLLRSFDQNILIICVVVAVYALMVTGLMVFVIPKVHGLNTLATIGYSGLFGLIVYGVFAMTNYAILQPWTIELMLLDTIWGFVLYSLTTVVVKTIFPNI
ncbi:MAG: DUF2177 family protein [Pseudomonadota bacterium]|nr:DUF2177 family protein [Pseudomonadota bacterium]